MHSASARQAPDGAEVARISKCQSENRLNMMELYLIYLYACVHICAIRSHPLSSFFKNIFFAIYMVARCDTWWITLNACESKISMCEARRFLCWQDPEAYSFSSFQTFPMPGCILRSVPASSHMYSSLTCLVPACHSGGRRTWATLSTWLMFISLPCLPCFAYLRPSYNPSIRLPAKGAEYCQTLFHILSHKWLPATGLDIFEFSKATRQLAFMQMQDHLHHCWRRSL